MDYLVVLGPLWFVTVQLVRLLGLLLERPNDIYSEEFTKIQATKDAAKCRVFCYTETTIIRQQSIEIALDTGTSRGGHDKPIYEVILKDETL